MSGMSATKVDVTSADIRVDGDVAVAFAAWSLNWRQEGRGPLPPHFKLTDTWVRGADGIWLDLSADESAR